MTSGPTAPTSAGTPSTGTQPTTGNQNSYADRAKSVLENVSKNPGSSQNRKGQQPPAKKPKKVVDATRLPADQKEEPFTTVHYGKGGRKHTKDGRPPSSKSRFQSHESGQRGKAHRQRHDEELTRFKIPKEVVRDPVMRDMAKDVSQRVKKLNEEISIRKFVKAAEQLKPNLREKIKDRLPTGSGASSSRRRNSSSSSSHSKSGGARRLDDDRLDDC